MGVRQTAKDPKGSALRTIPMKAYWTCPDGAIHRKATRRKCPVTEPVKVSPVDVQLAKLLVRERNPGQADAQLYRQDR